MKFSTTLLCLSNSIVAAKSGSGTKESRSLSDLVLNKDNSKLSSKSRSSKDLITAGDELDLTRGLESVASLFSQMD